MAYCGVMNDAPHTFSKNQIRKLGSRLRNAEVPSQEDVSAYILWSQGFGPSLSEIEAKVREIAERGPASDDFQISARIKQISSVRAKLIRQRTSLSDLEDIAGCRVILPSLTEVDQFILQCAKLTVTRTRDYRSDSNNGYRAVHLTLKSGDGHAVELQIRTRIQHAWAQLTERAAASEGIEVKYGGGPNEIHVLLDSFSKMVRLTDLRNYELMAGVIFEDIVADQIDDAQLQVVRSYRETLEADVAEQEASLIRLWATLFPEPGAAP